MHLMYITYSIFLFLYFYIDYIFLLQHKIQCDFNWSLNMVSLPSNGKFHCYGNMRQMKERNKQTNHVKKESKERII